MEIDQKIKIKYKRIMVYIVGLHFLGGTKHAISVNV